MGHPMVGCNPVIDRVQIKPNARLKRESGEGKLGATA